MFLFAQRAPVWCHCWRTRRVPIGRKLFSGNIQGILGILGLSKSISLVWVGFLRFVKINVTFHWFELVSSGVETLTTTWRTRWGTACGLLSGDTQNGFAFLCFLDFFTSFQCVWTFAFWLLRLLSKGGNHLPRAPQLLSWLGHQEGKPRALQHDRWPPRELQCGRGVSLCWGTWRRISKGNNSDFFFFRLSQSWVRCCEQGGEKPCHQSDNCYGLLWNRISFIHKHFVDDRGITNFFWWKLFQKKTFLYVFKNLKGKNHGQKTTFVLSLNHLGGKLSKV